MVPNMVVQAIWFQIWWYRQYGSKYGGTGNMVPNMVVQAMRVRMHRLVRMHVFLKLISRQIRRNMLHKMKKMFD